MAIFDTEKRAYERAKQEAFDELNDFLKTEEGRKALPNWINLLRYFDDIEGTIKTQEKEIKKYRNFFGTLSSLLPDKPSIHDPY